MVSVTHTKVSAIADCGDASLVEPSDWNAAHTVTGVREQLTVNTVFYVATTGNDSTGDGSVGLPWLTLQHAYNTIVASYDLAGFIATIFVGAGTYTDHLALSQPWTGGGEVHLLGDTTTPANVTLDTTTHCISNTCALPGSFTIAGVKFTNTTGFNACIANFGAGTPILVNGNIEFGASTGVHIWVANSIVNIQSNYIISGDAAYHYLAEGSGGAIIIPGNYTVSVSGARTFTVFALASAVGQLQTASSLTYSVAVSVTGIRYQAQINGVINIAGGGANFFPGDAPGSTLTGGQYA